MSDMILSPAARMLDMRNEHAELIRQAIRSSEFAIVARNLAGKAREDGDLVLAARLDDSAERESSEAHEYQMAADALLDRMLDFAASEGESYNLGY